MYAYVKLLEGSNREKKIIVHTSEIRNFSKNTHKNNIKYRVEVNRKMCSGIIMLLEDSKNDIIKRLKSLKRVSSIPERLMITASSGGTSSDEIIDDSLNSKASSKNTQEKNSDLEKILTEKLDKLTQSTMKDVDENQSQFISPNKEREHINVRRKADRAKLSGLDCWECEKYYKNLSLSKDELQKRKNKCSRHRRKYERPITPEGF